MEKIQPIAPTTGKMSAVDQKSEVSIPLSFTENYMTLWTEIASGTTAKGRPFSIGQGGSRVWVTFEGKHRLKGSIAKITISLEDLAAAAEKLADENDLLRV